MQRRSRAQRSSNIPFHISLPTPAASTHNLNWRCLLAMCQFVLHGLNCINQSNRSIKSNQIKYNLDMYMYMTVYVSMYMSKPSSPLASQNRLRIRQHPNVHAQNYAGHSDKRNWHSDCSCNCIPLFLPPSIDGYWFIQQWTGQICQSAAISTKEECNLTLFTSVWMRGLAKS